MLLETSVRNGGVDSGTESCEDASSDDSQSTCIRVGEQYQAELPSPCEQSEDTRDDILVWTPNVSDKKLDQLLKYIWNTFGERLSPKQYELALECLCRGRGDVKLALESFKQVRQGLPPSLSAAQLQQLHEALSVHGDDFHEIRLHLSAMFPCSTSQLVDAYFTHFYPSMPFESDFLPYQLQRRSRSKASSHRQTTHAQLVADGPLPTLAAMLRHGLLEPGVGVLSVTRADGVTVHADLMANGSIRRDDGSEPAIFRRLNHFSRSVTSSSANAWKIVNYKGICLELIREAAVNVSAALALVAAQADLASRAALLGETESSSAGGGSGAKHAETAEARQAQKGNGCAPIPPESPGAVSKLLHAYTKQEHPRRAQPQTAKKPKACVAPDPVGLNNGHAPRKGDDKINLSSEALGPTLIPHCKATKPVAATLAKSLKRSLQSSPAPDAVEPTSMPAAKPKKPPVEATLSKSLKRNLQSSPSADSVEPTLTHASKPKKPPPAPSKPLKRPLPLDQGERAQQKAPKLELEGGPTEQPRAAGERITPAPITSASSKPSAVSPKAPQAVKPSAAVATSASSKAEAEALLLRELEASLRRCDCKPSCSLLPLVDQGLLQPGSGCLTCCLQRKHFFADLTAAGTLLAKASDGSKLSLLHPCNLLHVASAQLNRSQLSAKVHPHKRIYYKGVKLCDVRAPARDRR
ncbi:hypothetical protein AB1Y20_010430 [Prymnesium parvum]|uniref:ELM2 domain-containing protein n=1 Tax=Prymnesium parvum TaxID=97485 RepID=A0AB34IPR2_PRYPA